MGIFSKGPALVEDNPPREFSFGTSIHPQDGASVGDSFIDNHVFTAKYTALNFLPKNMFEQFHRINNIYFLIISILQLVGGTNLSPSGRYTTIGPLGIVLLFSAVKEAFEDYKRHQSDRELNASAARIFRNGNFVSVNWENIRVGDICRISKNESFPCDMILLSSTSDQSVCYVETANLDGETNLKVHQAVSGTTHLTSLEQLHSFAGGVVCDAPNNKLYEFEGVLKLDNKEYKLSATQQLLRGCVLRNTEKVYGLVVYTGHDTKLIRNSSLPPTKFSRVDHMTNKANIMILILMLIICLTATFGNVITNHFVTDQMWYMYDHYHSPVEPIAMFFTFAILVNFLLPVSLYVTLELVKYICGYFIENDLEMYDESTGISAKSICSNLVEELGQIDYVFSDKTGTLTQNVMLFKECTVGGKMYGSMVNDSTQNSQKQSLDRSKIPKDSPDFYVDFPKMPFLNDLNPSSSSVSIHNQSLLDHFCWCLAINHSVLGLSNDIKPDQRVKTITYQASSPDENALVAAAHLLGFSFHNRGSSTVQVFHGGANHEIQILGLIPFNSTRKRMSIFVRLMGKIIMYTKGADSVIYERLDENPSVNSKEIKDLTLEHLSAYARTGLRTLCLSYREIDPTLFDSWSHAFDKADRDMALTTQDRKDRKAELAAQIETDLILIGATAIEDKLQEDVSDTLRSLSEAGIKTWVLTGDKMETAINIGFSSNLLTDDMDVLICYEHGSSLEHKEYPTPSGGGLSSGYREIVYNTLTKHLSEQRERLERMGLADRSKPGWFTSKIEKIKDFHQWFNSNRAKKTYKRNLTTEYGTQTYVSIPSEDDTITQSSQQNNITLSQPLLSQETDDTDYQSPSTESDAVDEPYSGTKSSLQMSSVHSSSIDDFADKKHMIDFSEPPISPRSIRFLANDGAMRAPIGENPFTELDLEDEEEASAQAPLALVISGKALEYALEPDMQFTLLQLSMLCQSVICCRVSPKQKADVVRLVKNAHELYGGSIPPATTLSIGDGANDVSMIMEAHVGVGIQGLEGLQAARSADYSIGQFRFLKHLLFKHGRLNYIRICNLILISFWKNSVFTLTQILYGIYNGWSSQLLYEQWVASGYNIFFTSGSIMFHGILEQDLDSKVAMSSPELYKVGTSNSLFNRKTFLIRSIGLSFIHAAILFYISYFGWTGVDSSDGRTSGIWTFGSIIYTSLVIVVNLKVLLISSFITWPLVGMSILSTAMFPIFNLIYGSLPLLSPTETTGIRLLGVYSRLLSEPSFYILVLLSVVTCLFPDYTYMAFQRRFYPSITDHVRFKTAQARDRSRARAPLVSRIMTKLRELGVDNLSAPSAVHRPTGFAFSEPTEPATTIRKPQISAAQSSSSTGPALFVT